MDHDATPDCHLVRESLSARADHEAEPLDGTTVDAHVATCADCASYAARLGALAEALTPIPATDAPDLTARIMARPPESARARLLRWGVGAMAGSGLAATLWELGLQWYRIGPDHAGHESAALTVAVWVGFALAAARPALARPYLPITAMAVLGLLAAAGVDAVAGRVTWTGELIHVNLVAAWVLTWFLARETPPTEARAASTPGPVWALPGHVEPH